MIPYRNITKYVNHDQSHPKIISDYEMKISEAGQQANGRNIYHAKMAVLSDVQQVAIDSRNRFSYAFILTMY
ncbi:hypothetical protein CFR74_10960 [Novacetimonas hansenii]|nr:hypothetical protein CFR74_10960 [Novacetimonas hansenii]